MPWKPGQSGNPNGRPSSRRAELDALLAKTWSDTSRRKVVKKLIADAEAGDHEARTLLLAYAYGKPKDDVEHTGGLTIRIEYVDDPTAEAPRDAAADLDDGQSI